MNLVYFYKENTNYYFKYNDIKYKVDNNTLSYLKQNIFFPYKLLFYNVPIFMIIKIINFFKDNDVKINYSKEFDNNYNITLNSFLFDEKKKVLKK